MKNFYFIAFVALMLQSTNLLAQAPPSFVSTPILTAQEGIPYSYSAVAIDGNGDRLVYSVPSPGLPSWLTLGPSDEINGIYGTWDNTDLLEYAATTAFDSEGNMYIGDWVHRVIRKFDKGTGTMSVVVGTGIKLNSGEPILENVLATSVNINGCSDIRFDSQDNMYFSDYHTHCIRRVDANTQMITTIFGTPWLSDTPLLYDFTSHITAYGQGFSYCWSLDIDAADNIYVAAAGNSAVFRITEGELYLAAGWPGGPADGSLTSGSLSDLRLNAPTGISLDNNGDLYIADRDNNFVRKVDVSGGTFTTIAGTYRVNTSTGDDGAATSATLIAPWRIDVDQYGNSYVVELDQVTSTGPYGLKIRRIDAITGIITTVAGDGTEGTGNQGDGSSATLAQLYYPYNVLVDDTGNIYIPDYQVERKVYNRGVLSGTPGIGDAGPHEITINAFDGTNTVPQTFTITVAAMDQAEEVAFSNVTNVQFDLGWTRGSGTKCVVFISETTTGTPIPVDNDTYTANTVFGDGTQIGSSGWYCIYNGTGTNVTVTGLTPNTYYKVMVCEYYGDTGSETYLTTTATNNPNEIQSVPISNWAIFLGLLLIGAFIVVRYRTRLV